MKKRIAVLLTLTLLLASLCGCGGVVSVSASAVPEAQRVKIALWYAPNGSPLWDNFTALLADYNNGSGATAGIRVSAKAFSSESELLTALSEAGAAAPAAVICGLSAALSLSGGAVMPATDTFFSAAGLGSIQSAYLDACAPDGKLLCVPLAAAPYLLLVNRSLASGAAYPDTQLATPEGVCGAAQKYNDDTGKHFFTADDFTALFRVGLAQYGDQFHASREQDIKNKHYVTLYNLLAEAAYNGGVTAVDGDAAKAVAAGELACAIVSASEIMEYAADPDTLSVLPYPVVSGGTALYPASLLTAAITASGSEDQTAAAVFLSWLLGNGDTLTANSGYYPSTQALSSVSAGSGASPMAAAVTAAVKAMAANGTVSLPAPSAAGYAADTAFEASFRETLAGLN